MRLNILYQFLAHIDSLILRPEHDEGIALHIMYLKIQLSFPCQIIFQHRIEIIDNCIINDITIQRNRQFLDTVFFNRLHVINTVDLEF